MLDTDDDIEESVAGKAVNKRISAENTFLRHTLWQVEERVNVIFTKLEAIKCATPAKKTRKKSR